MNSSLGSRHDLRAWPRFPGNAPTGVASSCLTPFAGWREPGRLSCANTVRRLLPRNVIVTATNNGRGFTAVPVPHLPSPESNVQVQHRLTRRAHGSDLQGIEKLTPRSHWSRVRLKTASRGGPGGLEGEPPAAMVWLRRWATLPGGSFFANAASAEAALHLQLCFDPRRNSVLRDIFRRYPSCGPMSLYLGTEYRQPN